MDTDEIQYIEKILNNEKNEGITEETFEKINAKKKDILNNLPLCEEIINTFEKKLENYRYVEELHEIQYGNYLRWINITNPNNLTLTNGAILCDIKINENTNLVFKNHMNKHFQINMDECLLFQKLTDQETIILFAIDYLNK